MTGKAHAVVTGGGSGIGLAIAAALAEAGHPVTIMGRDAARLDAARATLPGAQACRCDVADETSVVQAFADAAARSGPVGVLVNCAGIVTTAPFAKTDDDAWNKAWRVNVLGAVHGTRAVLPAMRTLPQGRVVNIASTAALKGYAYVSAYVASKHALLGLTRSLALELAGTAITVNAICPGYSDTEIVRTSIDTLVARTGRSREESQAVFTGANPQARLIAPEEVAATTLWLIGEGARSVTGQAIAVAGGEVM